MSTLTRRTGIGQGIGQEDEAYAVLAGVQSPSRRGLVAKAGRKFKATAKSDHDLPVAPDRLHQDFTAEAPNQKWFDDITNLWTHEGWLYLATVIDLYAKRVPTTLHPRGAAAHRVRMHRDPLQRNPLSQCAGLSQPGCVRGGTMLICRGVHRT